MENYYSVLGISEYTEEQSKIRAAYLNKVKYYHPDAGNVSREVAEEKTKELNAAYDTLKDPQKKAAYDQQLRYGSASPYSSYSNGSPYQTYQSYSSYDPYHADDSSSYGSERGSTYRQDGRSGSYQSGWFGPFHFYYYSSGSADSYGQDANAQNTYRQDPYGRDPYGTDDEAGRQYDHSAPYGSRQNPYGQQRYTYYRRPRFVLWRVLILLFLVTRLASCINYYIYYSQPHYYDEYNHYQEQQYQPQNPGELFDTTHKL